MSVREAGEAWRMVAQAILRPFQGRSLLYPTTVGIDPQRRSELTLVYSAVHPAQTSLCNTILQNPTPPEI